MAIYKNKEVTIEHVIEGHVEPSRAIVMYLNGARENVRLTDVVVTEDEKKTILENREDPFDNQLHVLDEKSETYKTIHKDADEERKEYAARYTSPEKVDLVKSEDDKSKKTEDKKTK